MKKIVSVITILVAAIVLVACQKQKQNVLRIGVGPGAMAESVSYIKTDFEALGYTLEITNITDYEQVNVALFEKDLDINFAQHEPFMQGFNQRKNANLVKIQGVYITEIYAFSNKYEAIANISNGASIAVMNDPYNLARTLTFMRDVKLIDFSVDAEKVTLADIENPKNLDIKLFPAGTIGSIFLDVDMAFMYPSAALSANLTVNDAITKEPNPSVLYEISVVARTDNKDQEIIKDFLKIMTSSKVRAFFAEKYPTYKIVF